MPVLIIVQIFFLFNSSVLSLSFLALVTGLEITICNCTQHLHKGFVNFQEDGCKPVKDPEPPRTAHHIIYSYQEEMIQFPGFICSLWYRQAEVVGGTIYGTKTALFSRQAKDTTPEECWRMKEFKTCDDHKMNKQADDTWRWDAEPSVDVPWLGHVKNKELNCLFEEVILEKRCETCAIETPFGSLSPTKHQGNISQHQVTMVWKDAWQKNRPCTLHKVIAAVNSTLTPLSSGSFRLRNNLSQMDFLIRPLQT